jgi:hypothetical protein
MALGINGTQKTVKSIILYLILFSFLLYFFTHLNSMFFQPA